MCPRTDQSQMSGSNWASKIAHFRITFRPITEIKCLLHITSQTSYSTAAVETNRADINDEDIYYDHKTTSLSHSNLWKSIPAAAISRVLFIGPFPYFNNFKKTCVWVNRSLTLLQLLTSL